MANDPSYPARFMPGYAFAIAVLMLTVAACASQLPPTVTNAASVGSDLTVPSDAAASPKHPLHPKR